MRGAHYSAAFSTAILAARFDIEIINIRITKHIIIYNQTPAELQNNSALPARGKTKMQALVAVMRKLLHAVYGMFKHQTAFDGNKLFALSASENSAKEVAA